MAAGIPSWFDADVLRAIVVSLVVALGVAALLVLAFVPNILRKIMWMLALLAAAGGLVYYRTTLDECEQTCDCRFVVDDLPTDGCPD